jgi:hypothetical protein
MYSICATVIHVVHFIPCFSFRVFEPVFVGMSFILQQAVLHLVRFEVFTVVTMKIAVFWDVELCRYCVNRLLGETYRLHLQGIRNPQARNQHKQVAAD